MHRLVISAILVSGLIGVAAPGSAAPCKDAKGKFIKCPPAPAKPPARCKNAKRHFAKCGTPGAKAI